MKNLYTLLDDNNFVINAQSFEDGKQPNNAVEELVTENFIKARFDIVNRVCFEGATQAEQDAYAEEEALKQAEQFMAQKEADGVTFLRA